MKSDEIKGLLPEIFQRGAREASPLAAVLAAMEAMHDPCEQLLERVDTFFDPYRTEPHFVPMLAQWVNLERIFAPQRSGAESPLWSDRLLPTELGHLRELVANAARLSQWRGTARGLRRFLEIATGLTGFQIIDEIAAGEDAPIPFHIRVRAPAAAVRLEGLIRRIVEQEKPAFVTWELQIDEGPADE